MVDRSASEEMLASYKESMQHLIVLTLHYERVARGVKTPHPPFSQLNLLPLGLTLPQQPLPTHQPPNSLSSLFSYSSHDWNYQARVYAFIFFLVSLRPLHCIQPVCIPLFVVLCASTLPYLLYYVPHLCLICCIMCLNFALFVVLCASTLPYLICFHHNLHSSRILYIIFLNPVYIIGKLPL